MSGIEIGVGIGAGLGLAAANGAADEFGHECFRQKKEEVTKFVKNTEESIGKACNEGWERDRNAGGISSWNQGETEAEMA